MDDSCLTSHAKILLQETTATAENNRFNYSHDKYSLIYNEIKKIGFENVDEMSDDMLQITMKTV